VWLPLAALAAIVLAYPTSAAPTKEVRRVLILNEANSTFPAISLVNQGIQAGLSDAPFHLDFSSEYMDTPLFPDPTVQREFRDFYIRKYRNLKIDVIMTVGPSPLKFMQEEHQRAFPGVPIVFCLPTTGARRTAKLESDFTGVENDIAPLGTVGVALRLQPGTKNVVVVGGVAPIDREVLTNVKNELTAYESRLNISYLTDLAMPDLLERLRHLPGNTVVLLTSVGADVAGTRFKSNESGPMVAGAANAPVFGFFDVYLNHGEVGGYLSSLSEQGRVAGGMALRVLRGEKPRDIPKVTDTNSYMFDWRALKHWGLNESAIPAGSIVLNRPATIWESHKQYMIGGIVLILGETVLILALIWLRAKAKLAESQLRESERRFRLVANTAPVMIWTAGTDRKCSYVNKTWLDFTGRPLEAELGDGWLDGLHPEDAERCLQTYTEAFNRRAPTELQYRLRRKDGEYRWILDYGVPRFSPGGTFTGYIGSCLDVTDRKLAEEAMATIGRRLIEAHEEERTWLARELHDDINQRLALLQVEVNRWDEQLPESAVDFHDHTRQVQQRLSDLGYDIQALSHRLHSSKLEYLGIVAASRSFCKELSDQQHVEIDFRHTGIPQGVPKEIGLCLFRVLQEGLQNAVKHSGARSFRVELRGTAKDIQLAVSDLGVGFDPQKAATRRGIGLISMRERLQLVNGHISIASRLGDGTTIHARVPFSSGRDSVMAAG